LLDPDQFDDKGLDYDELRKLLAEERCHFSLRRVKEELRDFNGRKLFLPRHAYTVDFELSGPEKTLYDDVTPYIREFLGRTYTGRRRMAVALARSVLQRRMASSLHAITSRSGDEWNGWRSSWEPLGMCPRRSARGSWPSWG
jgi:hypothetical protein